MTLYHQTDGFGLSCILNAGSIQPSSLNAQESELPAVWLTRSEELEASVGQPAKRLLGVDWKSWRIAIMAEYPTRSLEEWIEIAKPEAQWAESLRKYSEVWRVSLEAIPCTAWTTIERLDDLGWQQINWHPVVDRCRKRRNEEPCFPPVARLLRLSPLTGSQGGS